MKHRTNQSVNYLEIQHGYFTSEAISQRKAEEQLGKWEPYNLKLLQVKSLKPALIHLGLVFVGVTVAFFSITLLICVILVGKI